MEPGAPAPDQAQQDSEQVSTRHVTDLLVDQGWRVADVSRKLRGYDLHATKGRDRRLVEVKGVHGAASSSGIEMTGNEVLIATQLRREYWLYVIDNCADGRQPVRHLPRPGARLRRPHPRQGPRASPWQRPFFGPRRRGGPRMRMIERWFPCAEVSDASVSGWGSGKSEKRLFTWFAARPLAQAKAAVLTSLLPWPEDEAEQERLQQLVRDAMTGRDTKNTELRRELDRSHPDGASVLDLFSGRAMIPLEAARLGTEAHGVDYSPVATLDGALLADFPLRDWSNEPPLPFGSAAAELSTTRLLDDTTSFLAEIGRRYTAAVEDVYPQHGGQRPRGIPLGRHAALPGLRSALSADRQPRPQVRPSSQAGPRAVVQDHRRQAGRDVHCRGPRRCAYRATHARVTDP